MRTRTAFVLTVLAASACSSERERSAAPSTGVANVARADATELGTGDGSAASVTFTEIYTAPKASSELVDLAFAGAASTQLWVLGYGDDVVHVGSGVMDDANGTWRDYHDPAALHFMHKPPALAMGAGALWAVCGDNDNSQNDPRRQPNYFMGPSLFTTDLSIFATQNEQTGLGSHLDMLHNTSFCRGIAHVDENRYWTFNGELGALDLYDFHKPHAPGEEDHSDGEIYRYALGQVKGVDGVSSHLFYDPSDEQLYVADTGNARVGRLDTRSGTRGGPLPRQNEVLAGSGVIDGVTIEDVVPAGALEQPSGIEVHRGIVYVTDTATSTFHAFDKSGKELRRLETGLAPGSLSGFAFGPDGRIWFTDRKRGKVLRIDPPATE